MPGLSKKDVQPQFSIKADAFERGSNVVAYWAAALSGAMTYGTINGKMLQVSLLPPAPAYQLAPKPPYLTLRPRLSQLSLLFSS